VDPITQIDKVQHSSLVMPIWQHFNPSINSSLYKLQEWLEASSYNEFIVGIIKFENMSAILYTYGEAITNKALAGIEGIINKCLGASSKAIRNGFETIVFISHKSSTEQYRKCIDDIFTEISDYGTSIPETPVCLTLKIGAANHKKGDNFFATIDQAYMALYECAASECSNHIFFEEIAENIIEYQKQLKTAAHFQSSILQNRIKMAYQPVVDSKTGKVKSYEALLRIIDDNGYISSAGPMIPVAEKYGFINKIDIFVLENAIKELQFSDEVQLSINVSNASVHNNKWLQAAKSLITDSNVASRLIIELTETGVQRNLKKISEFVDNVHILGCKVAIDDFGAGYTSFSQLKLLEVDYIKIDGVFIKDICDNPDSKLFVKTLQEFAHAFGIKTIAEFVETGNIAKTLMELGVNYLQGYYFSKPVNYRPWIKDDRLI
jgi:EAL domain-containing protein (putative c-di-GMP-specific phosphodiesterase class I)/GGDEF domain-containing protein